MNSRLCVYRFFLLIGLLSLASEPGSVEAQPPQSANAASDIEFPQSVYRSTAHNLEFVVDDAASTKLVCSDRPVMSWSSLGGWSGDVFIWTGKGRVQVVGCIGSRQVDQSSMPFQEFHSFADEPIKEVKLDGSTAWNIPADAAASQMLEDAPQPAPSPARRLIQMRALARRFSVGMRITNDSVETDLRLLPQPIARESDGSDEVLDSALFAFVSSSGTDPEAFLLLEARTIDGKLTWTFRPARFTTREIWMARDQLEFWRAEPIDRYNPMPRIHSKHFYRDDSTVSVERD